MAAAFTRGRVSRKNIPHGPSDSCTNERADKPGSTEHPRLTARTGPVARFDGGAMTRGGPKRVAEAPTVQFLAVMTDVRSEAQFPEEHAIQIRSLLGQPVFARCDRGVAVVVAPQMDAPGREESEIDLRWSVGRCSGRDTLPGHAHLACDAIDVPCDGIEGRQAQAFPVQLDRSAVEVVHELAVEVGRCALRCR